VPQKFAVGGAGVPQQGRGTISSVPQLLQKRCAASFS
jgi:hypothetical protein